ncbi:serine/threonine-protein kinase Atg1p [[Candida] railenensis]|uniref:Serine/threonine-protein kinase ATG1 n=1 Tax=[Candida] railenensis TaxID=45579 RepID=A0A9P0QUL2_9ASCO|nr:serine/threonine-protein kinase Atg1p [[Candida] railenensis]
MSKRDKIGASHIGIYTIGPEIGKGSFATVYKCIDNKTHQPVAIKSVVRSKLKSKKLVENLEIEISILKTMKHPHIVGLLDCTQTSSHFHLVMDYCSMGDLSYFIRKRDQLIKSHPVISSLLERYPSPEDSHGLNHVLVTHFLKQLSSALEFLRSKSLVHRDIKPQNLLLCPPAHSKEIFEEGQFTGLWELPILKIADFGFARFLPSTSMAETLCGSPLYMAPEILRYEKYNAKADLWSVGAVLYEMSVGKPPFKADNHVQLLKNIEKSNDRIKFPSVSKVPESLKKLIRSLLKCNPTERISFTEFFNDPLIVGELEGNDKPLDTSEMDENLFISEYISPIPKIQELKQQQLQGHNSRQIPFPKSTSSSARDEEIKTIIHNNSPGNEVLSNSIQPKQLQSETSGSLIRTSRENEIIMEKDYVVVEKRAVEVNAIADELAHAGSGAVAIKKPDSDKAPHQQKSQTSPSQTPPKSSYKRGSIRSNSMTGGRRPSFTERRISISISPTNALSKAIGLASNRLFGTASSQPNNQITENVIGDEGTTYSTVISSPNFVNNLLLQNLNLPTSNTMAMQQHLQQQHQSALVKPSSKSDEYVLSKLESIATKAHAINLFADVKFSQLIPSPPSTEGLEDELMIQTDILPPKIVKSVSEEGVALYVKTLSLLVQGMAVASNWWYQQQQQSQESSSSLDSSGNSSIHLSIRINELVQWIREKFNECLEKAEFIRLRLQEANQTLRKEREEEYDDDDYSEEEVNLEERVIAEKLIFDRALEMSRNAAVNELVKEDLKGCELAYSTAIWMLEALLDEDSSTSADERLDDEDKAMVEKFIVSIGNRLSVLKKKLGDEEGG